MRTFLYRVFISTLITLCLLVAGANAQNNPDALWCDRFDQSGQPMGQGQRIALTTSVVDLNQGFFALAGPACLNGVVDLVDGVFWVAVDARFFGVNNNSGLGQAQFVVPHTQIRNR